MVRMVAEVAVAVPEQMPELVCKVFVESTSIQQ